MGGPGRGSGPVRCGGTARTFAAPPHLSAATRGRRPRPRPGAAGRRDRDGGCGRGLARRGGQRGLAHRRGRRPAVPRILGQRDHDDLLHRLRNPGRQRRRRVAGVHESDRDRGVGDERRGEGEALVGHDPQRVHIGGRGDRLTEDLLRGEVADRTEDVTGGGERLRGHHACDAEVGQHQPTVGPDQQVARLHVAVHDAVVVGDLQRLGGLSHHHHRVVRRERAVAAQHPVQRLARHELHHQVRQPVGLAVVVDLDNVRIGQRRHGVRLDPEPLGEARIPGQLGQQHLHRHDPAQHHVVGPPYLAHATASDRFA